MREELITFETAKLAKEKRFNVKCNKVYNTQGELWDSHYSFMENSNVDSGALCTAPTQSLLQKWLREEHNLHPYIVPYGDKESWKFSIVRYINKSTDEQRNTLLDTKYHNHEMKYNSYEEALEEGLQEALKLI